MPITATATNKGVQKKANTTKVATKTKTATTNSSKKEQKSEHKPTTTVKTEHMTYVCHESFNSPSAAKEFNPDDVLNQESLYTQSYMPDEVTRDCAARMHYAAFRSHRAKTEREAKKWRQKYVELRDLIVLGNQKLVYRAVRKRMAFAYRVDDMIGEGHIVLIRAVAAYNPWMGIRFSTYAFTCLMRALSRLTQQYATDWLSRSLAIETLSDNDLRDRFNDAEPGPMDERISQFFEKDHPLLSDREKYILACRYSLAENSESKTLAQVGEDLGLSKERVRQVQSTALGKLREALMANGMAS
ncbi:MAG: sigma-70 family RNA polymerase sigma factor [Gemmataceae bacterium]